VKGFEPGFRVRAFGLIARHVEVEPPHDLERRDAQEALGEQQLGEVDEQGVVGCVECVLGIEDVDRLDVAGSLSTGIVFMISQMR